MDSTPQAITGIVLAGGLSRRFGSNKLVHRLQGLTVIERVVSSLARVVDEVLVVVSRHTLDSIAGLGLDAKIVVDEEVCEGPLRGIVTGARHATTSHLLVVPGDSAWITPAVLENLVEEARRADAETASPLWGNGVVSPLHAYTSRRRALELEEACRRKPVARPTDLHRLSSRTLLTGTENLGPPRALQTLNTPRDLHEPPRQPTTRRRILLEGHNRYYWRALRTGPPHEKARAYAREAEVYEAQGALHLAIHALEDACIEHPDPRLAERIEELRAQTGLHHRHGYKPCKPHHGRGGQA